MKAYSIRQYKSYKAWDLVIDSLLLEYICYILMYVVWLRQNSNKFDYMQRQVMHWHFLARTSTRMYCKYNKKFLNEQ